MAKKILPKQQSHMFNVSLEGVIFCSIVFIIALIIAFALGVEAGKRSSVKSVEQIKTTSSEKAVTAKRPEKVKAAPSVVSREVLPKKETVAAFIPVPNPEAKPYLKNYFALIVKQVILNQFEQKIQERFRYDLERLVSSSRYFTRTISLLISLRMLNSTSKSVDMVLKRCFESMPCNGSFDLIDYVKYAVSAADSMFDSRVVWSEIARVRANRQPGLMPLGAELELSNLGFKTIYQGCDVKDEHFDGFRYFDDFLLDTLTWKLGGYIDDHGKDSKFTGNRGFLELAP